ncbi:MAG: bifunctional shikimate kinase/3-dehydroquinate synthase [Bifidobacteriaceae bacterium]|nr:bifunctional shikimate kinase/3-dehydroquinate synthase [Bifidobacteriaceae bacterium]
MARRASQPVLLHDGATPRVVFIGMPGAGKTRIGTEVAAKTGYGFIDTDDEIERREHMTVSQIFAEKGEPEFRRIENRVIEELLHSFGGVLSLGGGSPMHPDTRQALIDYVHDGGTIVYLRADPEEAMVRSQHGGNRPLLASNAREKWMSLYEQRDPVYSRIATVVVATRGKTPAKAAKAVMEGMNERIVHVTGSGIEPYDVRIGRNVITHLPEVLGEAPVRVALIHTSTVQRHSDKARTILRRAGYTVSDITIPDAEMGKTIEVANGIWKRLGDEGFTRSDAIVGLGGGACTDLAGFVAATWMRGIRYVNCPTSLLAMVDASTGGKTGINTEQGKNLVGSFYTPAGVLADLDALSTLPNDIFVEGLGEVAKSGFIRDPKILDILEANAERLRDFDCTDVPDDLMAVISELIERTVTVKAYHVSSDLKEKGLREFLNYGHTLAHAIEKLEHFRWRHGQAVAVGMVFAAELSHITGHIDSHLVDYHRSLLSSLGLRTSWNGGTFDEVVALMHRDKKARGNTLRFVILESIGHPIHLDGPDIEDVHEAFRRVSGTR